MGVCCEICSDLTMHYSVYSVMYNLDFHLETVIAGGKRKRIVLLGRGMSGTPALPAAIYTMLY